MYQGTSDANIGPRDAVRVASAEFGIDCEAEIAVVTGDVPQVPPASRLSPRFAW